MRGDSLRDLYAKVLAILGLGLLAGVGALVDYWPVATGTPVLVAGPRFLPALPALTLAADVAVPALARATAPRAVVVPVVAMPESIVAEAASGDLALGEPLTLSALPDPAVVPVPATEAPAAQIELPALPVPTAELIPFDTAPRLATSNQSESGFLMGALKKTGAGIVKTGAVTGATIMDAFKGVVGVFKKVSPFKDRATSALN